MSEINRKLATVERVKDIVPHGNADSLEIALIRGWEVIVQKDLYKKDQLVLFFEVDSFLPVIPQFEFLRKSSFRSSADIGEGFRIKTMKLRGVVSQGLVAPLADFSNQFVFDFPEGVWYAIGKDDTVSLGEGDDVTELLGVKKWETPTSACLKGDVAGLFPSFIPKTDEERWQNLSDREKAWHSDDVFEVTVKMDGQSVTVYHDGDGPSFHDGVCSRNFEIKESEESLHWKVMHNIALIEALDVLGRNIAIQGEFCGPGIQKNRMQLKEPKFFVFNIWDINAKRYLTSEQRQTLIHDLRVIYGVRLDHVDVLGRIDHIPGLAGLNDVVKSARFNGQIIEGIVFKSLNDPSFSFKYINPEYLLKEKD